MAKKLQFKVAPETLEQWIREDIDRADRYFTQYVNDVIVKRFQQYSSDPYYYKALLPRLSKDSSFVMSDVKDTINVVMPDLMRVFWGGQDPVEIEGRTVDDDPTVMKALISWQLERLNDGFLETFRWMRSACWAGIAGLEVDWVKEWETRDEVVTVSAADFLEMRPDDKVQIMDAEESSPGMFLVRLRRRVISKNQPVLSAVPIWELGWIPIGTTPKQFPMMFRRLLMTKSEIQRAVDSEILDKMPDDATLAKAATKSGSEGDGRNSLRNLVVPEGENDYTNGAKDPARTMHLVYKIYGRYDVDQDGRLEDITGYFIGDRLFGAQENTFERAPYFFISPDPDEFSATGEGFADKIGTIQDIKTALVRQIIKNVATNNDRGGVIDINSVPAPEDFTEDRKWKRLDLSNKNVGNVIQYDPEAPMSPVAFPFLEFLEHSKEQKSGVNRYKSGVNPKNLSKTLGEAEILDQNSNSQIEQIARMFAETGWKDLLQFLVECNQKFIDNEQVVRLEGKPLVIRPDDLQGKFDFVVSAGLGTGSKTAKIQRLANRLVMGQNLLPLGVVTPENIYNTYAAMLQEEGEKSVEKFATNPAQAAPPMVAPVPGQPEPGPADEESAILQAIASAQGMPR